MVFPLLPFYAKTFEASNVMIGFLASSFAFAQFLFGPVWGNLSDHFGRRPIIAVSLAGNAVTYTLFAFAPNLAWLFVFRFLQGVFASAGLPVARAYAADASRKEERIRIMGNLGASRSMGIVFGPAIGGILAGFHITVPFLAAALLAAVNFISVFLFLPESLEYHLRRALPKRKRSWVNITRIAAGMKSPLLPYFALGFLWSFGLSNTNVSIPLLGLQKFALSETHIGILFTFTGITSAATQKFFTERAARVLGMRPTILLGILAMAFSFLALPLAPFIALLTVAMMGMALGSSLSRPTLTALVANETKEGYGATMGMMTAFESAGRVIGPVIAGILFGIAPSLPFHLSAGLLILALWLLAARKNFLSKSET